VDLDRLQQRLGYRFNDVELLRQAITHRSANNRNYERLEFLGDAILGFLTAESLLKLHSDADEGQLSRMRARIVKRATLAKVADDLELSKELILGTGELRSGGHTRASILSDAVESIIAAVYLDSGMQDTTRLVAKLFRKHLEETNLSDASKDPKTRLQEYLQAQHIELPDYSVISISGKAHQQHFLVECRIDSLDLKAEGQAETRKYAEQQAAAQALQHIGVT